MSNTFLLRSHCPKKPSWMFSFSNQKDGGSFNCESSITIPHTLLHFRGHIASLGDNDCDSDRVILQLPAPSCEPPFCELHRQTPEPSTVISNYWSRNVGAAVTAASTPPLSGPWPYSARHRCSPWYDTNRVVTWCRALGKRKACPWWSRAKKERSN